MEETVEPNEMRASNLFSIFSTTAEQLFLILQCHYDEFIRYIFLCFFHGSLRKSNTFQTMRPSCFAYTRMYSYNIYIYILKYVIPRRIYYVIDVISRAGTHRKYIGTLYM